MIDFIKKGNTFEGIPAFSNNFRKDVFHIVDKIPKNYQIWSISVNADFLPLCVTDGGYTVNLGSLLAVEMPKSDADILITASMWAGYGEKKFNRFLTEKNKKRYPEIYETVKKAIPLLKKYS